MLFRNIFNRRTYFQKCFSTSIKNKTLIELSKPYRTFIVASATLTTSYFMLYATGYNVDINITKKPIKGILNQINDTPDPNNVISSGNISDIRLFLNNLKEIPKFDIDALFLTACVRGSVEIVDLLLNDTKFNPGNNDSEAFRIAVRYGHFSVVERLLKDKRVDPSAKCNQALCSACSHGYSNIVELLLKDERVDPSTNYNNAVLLAVGHPTTLNLMLNDPRIVLTRADKEYIEGYNEEYMEGYNEELYTNKLKYR